MGAQNVKKNCRLTLFPETRGIVHARAGTPASKFMCAISPTREIIVFSLFAFLL